MRALAEFIIRGRLQAGLVAVLGYVVPLLTPVTVALVTLRKGAFEGTMILWLGLFPAILSLVLSSGDSVVVWVTFLSLLTVYVPAIVLRVTISLPLAIITAVLTSLLISAASLLLVPDAVDRLMASLASQMLSPDAQPEGDIAINQTAIMGMIAYVLAFNGLVGMFIGRWLQAIAFNPGGFATEFRSLSLGAGISVACFLISAVLRFQGTEYLWWSNLFALPLLLVSAAIAHHIAAAKQLKTTWLVLFYFAAFVFTPLVICIGFVDAWVNFRDRFQTEDDHND